MVRFFLQRYSICALTVFICDNVCGLPKNVGIKNADYCSFSTTELDYIALSFSLCEVILVLNLLKELKLKEIEFNHSTPVVKCLTFEDNKSRIHIVTNLQTRPQTKHLSVRLLHFRSHIIDETISIEHISTFEKIADMVTKLLPVISFESCVIA